MKLHIRTHKQPDGTCRYTLAAIHPNGNAEIVGSYHTLSTIMLPDEDTDVAAIRARVRRELDRIKAEREGNA